MMRYSTRLLLLFSVMLMGCSSTIEMLDAPLRSHRQSYSAPTPLSPFAIPPELAASEKATHSPSTH
jgi:hypothetical protein